MPACWNRVSHTLPIASYSDPCPYLMVYTYSTPSSYVCSTCSWTHNRCTAKQTTTWRFIFRGGGAQTTTNWLAGVRNLGTSAESSCVTFKWTVLMCYSSQQHRCILLCLRARVWRMTLCAFPSTCLYVFLSILMYLCIYAQRETAK